MTKLIIAFCVGLVLATFNYLVFSWTWWIIGPVCAALMLPLIVWLCMVYFVLHIFKQRD